MEAIMFQAFTQQPALRPHARDLVQPGGLVLDVRTRDEFADAHVEGALNIPVQELAQRMAEVGERGRKVVVYCRSGGRSAVAAELLRRAGYDVTDVGPMPR
jgi:phage shock protein E